MRISKILKSNNGSSLVLVSALTIIIVALTVSLRIAAGMIMSSANKQLNQDQAYELAVSLGNSLESRILNADTENGTPTQLPLSDGATLVNMSDFDGMPDADVKAVVSTDGDRYVLTVTSHVGKASYIWEGIYKGSPSEGYRKCVE
ncbi:MAG: hypothetical protein K6G19_07750 [Lachnospiraceae bacterium]|nr:hypothetical protein [Lachnospiraceae bacterium]